MAGRSKTLSVLAGLIATFALAPAANAHQSSFTYARAALGEDGQSVSYQIKLKSTDLYEAIELDRDRDATNEEILAAQSKLSSYVGNRVAIETDGATCKRSEKPVTIEGKRDRYAVVAFDFQCDRALTKIVIEYDLFFDLDPRHIGLLVVDGESYQLASPDHTRFEWIVGEPIEGGMGFIQSGIEHIVFGLDHILFLISLLLMAVITRSEKGGWKLRPPREGFVYTAAVVTSFTLAHSLTLIAAALGWIDLPGRLVESVIAASIVFVALENILRPDPPRRYLVTFGFGLIHGLGFAAMLRPLLPPEDVVVPLLLFNVGVELGQLAIVAVALPLLYLVGRAITANRYRQVVLPIGGAILGGLGAIWLIERAFEITLLGL